MADRLHQGHVGSDLIREEHKHDDIILHLNNLQREKEKEAGRKWRRGEIRSIRKYSGAKKYLVSHQLCKFSHLKR